MRPGQELCEDLTEVRRLLVLSPLVSSLEGTRKPFERAIEALRRAEPLDEDMRRWLRGEVALIGQLMGGLGQWLTATGALTPTYNREAEFQIETGSSLAVEG